MEYSSMENKEVAAIVTSTSHEKGESIKQVKGWDLEGGHGTCWRYRYHDHYGKIIHMSEKCQI